MSNHELAWLGTVSFSRLSYPAGRDNVPATNPDDSVEAVPMLLNVAGDYLAVLLSSKPVVPWLDSVAALCSVPNRCEALFRTTLCETMSGILDSPVSSLHMLALWFDGPRAACISPHTMYEAQKNTKEYIAVLQ